jgi:predicted transposase YbfD/YdcC
MVFLPPTTPSSLISEPIFRLNPVTQAVKLAIKQLRKATILEYFSKLTDPRLNRKKRHLLEDIVVLAICGILGGADDWVSIEAFGIEKYHWFKQFLSLPNGIPSHDTFGRVFSLLSPDEFQACFTRWIHAIAIKTQGQVVPIDGKTLRRSHDRGHGQSAIHMVSAWASENRLVLGQLKTDDKSNEITAMPELLQVLDISGCIITIDAMGCQKNIAEMILKKEADYVLALKANQENLFKEVTAAFAKADSQNFQDPAIDYYEIITKDHGRLDIRRYWVMNNLSEFKHIAAWKNLRLIGMVESERTVRGKTKIERRYYISSLEKNASLFAKAVRLHWGIENSVHWVLDMAFREDESRVRKGHAPENLAVLRHIALNLLRDDPTPLGIKNKRLKAGWSTDYLTHLLWG